MPTRREFISTVGTIAAAATVGIPARRWPHPHAPADHTIRIAPTSVELSPRRVIRTATYNGAVPGPIIRLREGETARIEVINETDVNEMVHWHGLYLPSNIDGAHEQGTPHIPPGGRTQFDIVGRPGGTRWYHTHGYAGHNLNRATYTGQFGFLVIDPRTDPGRYDQEVFLALHNWDPYITGGNDAYHMVMYNLSTINGRLLGFADPVRVREGQRVLFRMVNASASLTHWISLPAHQFLVTALDGNPVPTPSFVDVLRLAPGERVDAVVTMSTPGVWVLGEPRDIVRNAGMGVVVEYANHTGPPEVTPRPDLQWSYARFADREPAAARTAEPIRMVFRAAFHGHGDFEHWTINGQSFPAIESAPLVRGTRYRFVFDNQSPDEHPLHLHRHSFELTSINGRPTSGLRKDVVLVPARTTMEAEFVADNPGLTLFHCHQQEHMDSGFKTVFRYA